MKKPIVFGFLILLAVLTAHEVFASKQCAASINEQSDIDRLATRLARMQFLLQTMPAGVLKEHAVEAYRKELITAKQNIGDPIGFFELVNIKCQAMKNRKPTDTAFQERLGSTESNSQKLKWAIGEFLIFPDDNARAIYLNESSLVVTQRKKILIYDLESQRTVKSIDVPIEISAHSRVVSTQQFWFVVGPDTLMTISRANFRVNIRSMNKNSEYLKTAVSPDETLIAWGGVGAKLLIYDTRTQQVVFHFDRSLNVIQSIYFTDSQNYALANVATGLQILVDLRDMKHIEVPRIEDLPSVNRNWKDAVFLSNSDDILFINEAGRLMKFKIADMKAYETGIDWRAQGLRVSQDGKKVLMYRTRSVGYEPQETIAVFNLETQDPVEIGAPKNWNETVLAAQSTNRQKLFFVDLAGPPELRPVFVIDLSDLQGVTTDIALDLKGHVEAFGHGLLSPGGHSLILNSASVVNQKIIFIR